MEDMEKLKDDLFKLLEVANAHKIYLEWDLHVKPPYLERHFTLKFVIHEPKKTEQLKE